MIIMQLAEAARIVTGEWQQEDAEVTFCGISTDSRQCEKKQLFVALSGPNFDGHDFVPKAAERGVAAALVERRLNSDLPQLQVADCVTALGQLGVAWRQGFAGKLVALTGSNGKTTTKEMIAVILRQAGKVSVTQGNLNNHIGLPLTLACLHLHDDYAVLEMGANHAGEIAYLTGLAKPDVALITNAGPAHLEGFGDIAGVARAKGEIFQGLVNHAHGIAVINADDDYADYWRGLNAGREIIDFGLHKQAFISAEVVDKSTNLLRINYSGQVLEVTLPVPGQHNIYNALAASAVAYALTIAPEHVVAGLQSMVAVSGRLQTLPGPVGSTVINDTYNANPASWAAALEILSQADGAKWMVFADMAELGGDSNTMHTQLGYRARSAGVDRLYALGEKSQLVVDAFGNNAQHCADHNSLYQCLLNDLAKQEAPTILVKGSRSMAMERIVQALISNTRAVS